MFLSKLSQAMPDFDIAQPLGYQTIPKLHMNKKPINCNPSCNLCGHTDQHGILKVHPSHFAMNKTLKVTPVHFIWRLGTSLRVLWEWQWTREDSNNERPDSGDNTKIKIHRDLDFMTRAELRAALVKRDYLNIVSSQSFCGEATMPTTRTKKRSECRGVM